MQLSGIEFLRRFVQHILPHGFIRIRHYGFLASKNKSKELNEAKVDLKQEKWEKVNLTWQQIAEDRLGLELDKCKHCKENNLIVVKIIEPKRGLPNSLKVNLQEWK